MLICRLRIAIDEAYHPELTNAPKYSPFIPVNFFNFIPSGSHIFTRLSFFDECCHAATLKF